MYVIRAVSFYVWLPSHRRIFTLSFNSTALSPVSIWTIMKHGCGNPSCACSLKVISPMLLGFRVSYLLFMLHYRTGRAIVFSRRIWMCFCTKEWFSTLLFTPMVLLYLLGDFIRQV
jgi:hypothetical protein